MPSQNLSTRVVEFLSAFGNPSVILLITLQALQLLFFLSKLLNFMTINLIEKLVAEHPTLFSRCVYMSAQLFLEKFQQLN